jgi:hypothetical protein
MLTKNVYQRKIQKMVPFFGVQMLQKKYQIILPSDENVNFIKGMYRLKIDYVSCVDLSHLTLSYSHHFYR